LAEDSQHSTQLDDRPAVELLRQLSEQTSTLVRQELDLARAEMTEKGKQAGIGAGMFGAAGVVGLFALGGLTAALILLLATAVTPWVSALIVAAVYGAVAGGLALNGRNRVTRAVPPVPEQTVDSVTTDVEMTRERAKEGRR
jgi:hypothetical protein